MIGKSKLSTILWVLMGSEIIRAWYDYFSGAIALLEGFQFSVFSLLLGISTLTGLVWVYENAPARQAKLHLDAAVGILAGAFLGSRAGFVIFRWDYFQNHLLQIIQFYAGGYSWVGMIIGWLVAALIISRIIHQPLLVLCDFLLPLAGCLAVGIWLGCWFEGIAYGGLSTQWWAIPAVDEWGIIANRFPIQLIGAISTLFFMILLNALKGYPAWKRWLDEPGFSTAFFLSMISIICLLLSFLRQDPAPTWLGLRLDTCISAGFSIMGVILWGVIVIRKKRVFMNKIMQNQNTC